MAYIKDLYCNPLPLPDLPLGMDRIYPGRSKGYTGKSCDYREVADPEVLKFGDAYYMYVSCRQVYVSWNLIDWEYHAIDIDSPLGYAPAVTQCGKNIYLTSSKNFLDKYGRIYAAEHPLGPFKTVGYPKDKNGNIIEDFLDPALFTDDDGRLYLYWGYAPLGGGIYGMEVDPEHPDCGISDIVKLIDLDPDNEWEHFGAHGEVLDFGWNEGASMYKYHGRYYLQYAACGTRFPNYAIGVYILNSPLEKPSEKAHKLICNTQGIVCGTGHGGMFPGPDGEPWQAYSVLVHRKHVFERRVGIDPVKFDDNGVPFVEASDVPCSVSTGKSGLVNAAAWKNAVVSSSMINTLPMFALDECPHTAWIPEPGDKQPMFRVNLEREFEISAVRLIWSEENISFADGVNFEPAKYKIEFYDGKNELVYLMDKSTNQQDKLIEFHSFEPVTAQYVQVTQLKDSSPVIRGITDLAVFVQPRRIYK